ncbi:MAG: glycosyltransferase family 4 protein [Haloarculaceae archaeon]
MTAADELDVGFVPAECPGADATGATHTSTLLIERLSAHHDLTVYVSSQMGAADRTLPAEDRVEYVLHDDLPRLPHPVSVKIDALREEQDALERHDLVHSYSTAFIPVLADLDVPTIVTLNSYVPVCPKGDMLYGGTEPCSGPAPAKCAGCVARTALSRRQGLEAELRAGYTALGRLPFVERCLDRAADVTAYQALSPHLVDDYASLGFPGDRIRVVPHFCDEQFLALDDGGRWDGGTLSLLYVGALRDIKGVDLLVRALPALADRGLDVDLRVAGTGPYGNRCRALAADLGVEDRVTWLGHVDHDALPAEYARADAVVYPGRLDEPFGRVLLEALGTRTPVVAADVGSTDWIVGEGGVRFTPDDPAALADACVELTERYGAVYDAIPDQVERFRPGRVIAEFLDLYASVATGPGGERAVVTPAGPDA